MSSYDTYEYTGYIVPGTVLLLGLILLCPRAREWMKAEFGDAKIELAVIFVIVAFTLGHLLHGLGHFVDQLPKTSCKGGISGTNAIILYKDHQDLLSDDELSKLAKAVEDSFYVKMMRDLTLSEKKDRIIWCNVTIRISSTVHHDNRGGLLDIFIRSYGLYLGLSAALITLMIGTLMVVALPLDRPPWMTRPHAGIMLLSLLVASTLTVWRMFYFGELYARELFLAFLAVPKS